MRGWTTNIFTKPTGAAHVVLFTHGHTYSVCTHTTLISHASVKRPEPASYIKLYTCGRAGQVAFSTRRSLDEVGWAAELGRAP